MERILDILTYNPEIPMFFNTGLFLVLFLLLLFVCRFLRPRPVIRKMVIILFSCFFYYKASHLCLLILISITLCDYLLGLWMQTEKRKFVRRGIVVLNVVINIGILSLFKYFNLMMEVVASLRGTHFDALVIILPAGISFFTFRSISYIVDIYRNDIKAETNLLNYIFSTIFFPPLLAGPIVRAKDILPQVRNMREATSGMTSRGFFLIMCGIVKKMVIADFLSFNLVDRVFDNPLAYSGVENILACVGFLVQLYCDFSGYSDMAIGIALLLGFTLKDNFNAPFKAQNPSKFWHRWHISLSSWLRDYLYIPLGGSHCHWTRTTFNLLLTMALGGLWHGASWMFLLWGLWMGVLLVAHRWAKPLFPIWWDGDKNAFFKVANIAFTFILTAIGFTFFRASSLETIEQIVLSVTTNLHADIIVQYAESYPMVLTVLTSAIILHFLPHSWTRRTLLSYSILPQPLQALVLAIILFLAYQAGSADLQPYIYMQY